MTLAAQTTAGVSTTTTPPTTPTPPPTALQLDPQAFFEQEFAAAVGEHCLYLYPGRGGIGRLVGMDETAARTEVEQCGWVFRVTHRDGVDLTITADFQGTANSAALGSMTYGITSGFQLTTGGSIDYNALGALTGVDGTASSSAGGAALLHVPTNSVGGGTTTIKVQHDSASDFSSAADLISFTNVAAATKTSEMVVCSGTVNRYVRATASTAGSSGSITFMVSFARF